MVTEAEIERLMAAARKASRYGHRDATISQHNSKRTICKGICDAADSSRANMRSRLRVRNFVGTSEILTIAVPRDVMLG
jgi:hypothetical protein